MLGKVIYCELSPWDAQVPGYHRRKFGKWVRSISNGNNDLPRSVAFNEESGTAIIECKGTRTHNHLVRKQTLNHLAKLTSFRHRTCFEQRIP